MNNYNNKINITDNNNINNFNYLRFMDKLNFRRTMLGYDNNPNNSKPNFNNNRPEQSESAEANEEKGFFDKAKDHVVNNKTAYEAAGAVAGAGLVIYGIIQAINYFKKDKKKEDETKPEPETAKTEEEKPGTEAPSKGKENPETKDAK